MSPTRAALAILLATASSAIGAAEAGPATPKPAAAGSSEPGRLPARLPGVLSIEAFERRPKLVVVVVIDQFRADYLTRFGSRFLPARGKGGAPGGFRLLMNEGAWYPQARYEVLQAMTGPGHATILTGSYPSRNGVPLNVWCELDAAGRNRPQYCVQDDDSPLVGSPGRDFSGDAQGACNAPSNAGVSPRHLVASTVGDELKTAGYPSRVVSIALKDRAAVLLGGQHPDLALWFDDAQTRWISSRYYLPGGELPAWVERLNGQLAPRVSETVTFAPSAATGTGLTQGKDFGMSAYIGQKGALKLPFGVQITVDATIEAVRAMELGRGAATDLLAVSLSSHDYLGHDLGPNRRELEEMTVAEDRELSRLFAAIDAAVPGGLDETVIALTGDHGIGPVPGFVRSLADRGASTARLSGYVDGDEVRRKADAELRRVLGPPARKEWVTGTVDLNFFLDREGLAQKGIAPERAEQELKKALLPLIPSTSAVVTRSDVEAGRVPGAALADHVRKGYLPGRSGDVIVIARPYFLPVGDVDSHFTDYSYDVTVPLVLRGRSVRPGVYAQPAHVVDLAPTISFLLGTVAPTLSEGRVLHEALGR
jgi:hypothetical protein